MKKRSGPSQRSNQNNPGRYVDEERKKIEDAAEKLCRFIDPHKALDVGEGPRWPLVILAFDESHILTEFPEHCDWTLFSELCCMLQVIGNRPIFSLFLSIVGSLVQNSPEIKSDPSSRVVNHNLRPLEPITEICFDDIAYPAQEGRVSLSEVITTDWISHLGRPLCVHFPYTFRE